MTANEANATFPDKTKQEYGHSSSLDSNGGTEEELRREVQKLKQQLEEILLASSSVSNSIIAHPDKSGYLFKWQDRSIGWSGTKWGLRFVRLNHGQLSYYRSHEERSPRYILTLKNCAVRDEGWKVNKRHNKSGIRSDPGAAVGSHFHVFSIYQRPVKSKASGSESEQENQKTKMIDRSNEEDAQNDDENEIVPLLRFSTESLAEKNQWIDLISKACAYCDTEEFTLAQQQQQNLQEQQHQPPSHAEKGTLPALYFEPHRSISSVPSGYGLDKMGKRHQKKSAAVDAARSNKISYPPSKPMHRQSNPSYLSEGAHVQNYRGMFNLLVIILIVSNFRLLLDTVSTHGFILGEIGTLSAFWEAGVSEKMADFPFVSGLMIVQVFIVGGYCIEKMLSRGWVGDRLGLLLHVVNTNASLGVVMGIVWNYIDHPVVGAALIMQAAITWLKLISYAHANYDYRVTSLDKHMATVALVKDLDADGLQIAYPQNITLANIYFFWFAPTLTYQIAYPRTPFTRWIKVAMLTIHLFVSATLIAFLAAQVIAPNLDSLMKDLEGSFRFNRCMKRFFNVHNYFRVLLSP